MTDHRTRWERCADANVDCHVDLMKRDARALVNDAARLLIEAAGLAHGSDALLEAHKAIVLADCPFADEAEAR